MIFIKLLYSGNMEYSWGKVWTVGHLDSVARLHRPDIQQTQISIEYFILQLQIHNKPHTNNMSNKKETFILITI